MLSDTSTPSVQPLTEPAPKGSPKAREMNRAAARLAAPFFVWIGMMLLNQLMHLTPSAASEETLTVSFLSDAQLYAVRTGLAGLLILVLRPWKFFAPAKGKNLLWGLFFGILVFALWVFPESDFIARHFPGFAALYETWCVTDFGALRDAADAELSRSIYHPSVTGWPMWIIHMFGSGIVVAIAEEFFWRGYLLRAARTPDFLDLDPGEFHPLSFFAVALVFAFEHGEVAAGFLTALIYGFFFLRTRDIWAVCLAHCTTNLLLGVYVLQTNHWEFW